MQINELQSGANCAKLWILPDGTIKPLSEWHHRDLASNSAEYLKKFDLSLRGIKPDDEQAMRLKALKAGFVRVNFEHRSGVMTFEALDKFWYGKVQDSALSLVLENLDNLDHLRIHLLNDKANVVKSGDAALFRYSSRDEKIDALPTILTEGKTVDRTVPTIVEARPDSRIQSSGTGDKFWLTDDGEFIRVGCHQDWLRTNKTEATKAGMNWKDLDIQNRQALTLRAMRTMKWARIDWDYRSGALTVEAHESAWRGDLKSALFSWVLENLDNVDSIRIHLVNDEGKLVDNDFASLFQFHERDEKIEAIPKLLTEGFWHSSIHPKVVAVSETRLGRVWSMIEDDRHSFAIISAFIPKKKDQDPEEWNQQNITRHKELVKEIDGKYGYTALEGGYTYGPDAGPMAGATETNYSLMISGIKKEDALALGKKFNQESIIWKSSDEFQVMSCDGEVYQRFKMRSGRDNFTFNQDVLKMAYSAMLKSNHAGRKFAFVVESIHSFESPGWAMAMGGFSAAARIDLIGRSVLSSKEKQLVESVITESGLSRIHQHIVDHDCAIISASRYQLLLCDAGECSGRVLTKEENKKRTRQLKAALLSRGYGVTEVDGSYIENYKTENAIEVKEPALFVVNLKDDGNFLETIKSFGRFFCQDSVVLKPKNSEDAVLFGTNHAEFPGFGESVSVGNFVGGVEAQFMTRVSNRPFVFQSAEECCGLDTLKQHGWSGAGAIMAIAKPVLESLKSR